MNDSTFYKFIDDIDSLVNKIHFTHEKFSLTQTDRLKELIDLSQNLLDKLIESKTSLWKFLQVSFLTSS